MRRRVEHLGLDAVEQLAAAGEVGADLAALTPQARGRPSFFTSPVVSRPATRPQSWSSGMPT